MVVQRIGAFLRDALQQFDGKTVVVIGRRATRYGIEYWCGDASLEEIVRTPWEWREIPIWRYELDAQKLERPQVDMWSKQREIRYKYKPVTKGCHNHITLLSAAEKRLENEP